ncbi:MAG: flagellar basal body P-ring protein FlgI [Candidatus Margulisiibacteriota bacterium]
MKNKIAVLILFILITALFCSAQHSVRIKDIARINEVRSNQLVGFGLVVGLQNTGDTQSAVTEETMQNLLSKMGLPKRADNKGRNVASVLVTAELPPFAKEGQKIDVSVASMGDATSLKGGLLIMTPLMAANGKVYAVAQGSILLGVKEYGASVSRRQINTSAAIPGGAMVERTITINLRDKNILTLALNNPDFTQAARVANVLNRSGISGSKAINASTIEIPLIGDDKDQLVKLISRIENITVEPVSTSKVVINEKTGSIVMGQYVTILPAIVSFGSINVVIGEYGDQVNVEENTARIVKLQPDPTLSSLATALRSIGATTSDMISILQVLKKAGALQADLEVI